MEKYILTQTIERKTIVLKVCNTFNEAFIKMKEVLLCKYGEIVLKGANRAYFEDMLCKELRKRAKKCGNFDVLRAQSTVYIEPQDDFCDMDAMLVEAQKVFGIVAIAAAVPVVCSRCSAPHRQDSCVQSSCCGSSPQKNATVAVYPSPPRGLLWQ